MTCIVHNRTVVHTVVSFKCTLMCPIFSLFTVLLQEHGVIDCAWKGRVGRQCWKCVHSLASFCYDEHLLYTSKSPLFFPCAFMQKRINVLFIKRVI